METTEKADANVDLNSNPEAQKLLEQSKVNGKVVIVQIQSGNGDVQKSPKKFAESTLTDPASVKLIVQNEKSGKEEITLKTVSHHTSTETKREQKGCKRFFGILLAVTAALQFSLSALIIKILKYHPFNLGVWRFSVMVLFPLPFLIHAKIKKKQNVFADVWPIKSTTFYLILQAALGSNSIIFVFFGLRYLNIADSIVIGTSAPVFVTLFAFIFLGEKCGVVPLLTALLALFGVAIISKPPILTGDEHLDEDTLLGVASSFSSMILLTICYVVIRYLRKVHHALVNLCFALWGLVQSIIVACVMDVLEAPRNYQEVGLIITTALLAFGAQTCLTLALKYEQAGPVALVRTTEVVFAFIWQALFLGVTPDYLSVIGAIVTLSGVVLTALRKMVMSLPDGHRNKKRFKILLI